MILSVIIPTYNRVALLPRAINSVLSQELPEHVSSLQLIVVDDGSDDGTAEMIALRYPEVDYVYQDNAGVSAARNRGVRKAIGEWLALLDSDDEWLANKLQRQFETLVQTKLLVCHTQEIWFRDGRRVNQMNKHQKRGGWIYEHCLPMCAMSPSSIIIHQSVFEKVGVFDEELPACEDYDLWLRIAANYEVAYVEQACINKFGGHEDQLSRKYWGMDRFRVVALERILNMNLSPSMRSATKEMLIKKLKILHAGALKRSNTQLIESCNASMARISTYAL